VIDFTGAAHLTRGGGINMKPEATMEQEHEAEAVLSVSCCVDCPNCNDTFDLFDMTSLTDDNRADSRL